MIQEIIKFSTPTCGQCKVIDKFFKDKGVEYTNIDCTLEENEDIVAEYHISHVPVVIIREDDGSQKRFNNIAEVREWLAHIQ